jgi:hypothetical protein
MLVKYLPRKNIMLFIGVLNPGYHGPSIMVQKIWIRPDFLHRQMVGEPNTPYQIWSHNSWLKMRDQQSKKD